MESDLGTARRFINIFKRVVTLAAGFPQHTVLWPQTGAAGAQGHLVGDDKAGIEPDAELANQVGVPGLITGQLLHELASAGAGDGADVINDFLPIHADAVIGHGDGAGILVETDPDFQIGVVFVQRAISQRFETQLIAGVRGVGDQFTEKDFLVGIQGMRDQAQ